MAMESKYSIAVGSGNKSIKRILVVDDEYDISLTVVDDEYLRDSLRIIGIYSTEEAN